LNAIVNSQRSEIMKGGMIRLLDDDYWKFCRYISYDHRKKELIHAGGK
jgi:hypothetical protein